MTMHKKAKLGIMIAAAIMATGCGGSGSSGSANDSTSGNNATSGEQAVTVSGRAADGYLVQANVCADLNGNAQCDAGEPNTTTGPGGVFELELLDTQLAAEIVVEAIANLTVDEDTNQPIPDGFTLRSPIIPGQDEQFVSPVTTMVASELKKGETVTLEQAKQAVAQRLGTTFDPFKDYIAGKDSGDAAAQQNAERLHRIAQVTARIMAKVEKSITQTDLAQAGITKAEFLELASQAIAQLAPVIVLNVDQVDSSTEFDPDAIADLPDLDITGPSEPGDGSDGQTDTPSTDTLLDRLATATAGSPFFRETPSGLQAVEGGNTSYLNLIESDTSAGKYHLELLQRTLMSGSGNTGSIVTIEGASKAINGQVQVSLIEPEPNRVRVFLDGRHYIKTTASNYLDQLRVTATQAGSLDGEAYRGITGVPGLRIEADYSAIDLSQLSIKATLPELYPSVNDADLAEISDNAIFPDGSEAYAVRETFADPLFVTSWHGLEGSDFGSDSHCSPHAAITVVQSCNVVYGAFTNFGNAAPAPTFDDLTYDPTVFTDGSFDPNMAGGIGFESNGQNYVLYLAGNKADGSGQIMVGRNDSGTIVPAGEGSWSVVSEPFEHIRLTLPDGIQFNAFLDGFGGDGYAFLHEYEGFVRAGWASPAGVELATYFDRNPETLLLNETAVAAVVAKLQEWDKLAAHPGWENQD